LLALAATQPELPPPVRDLVHFGLVEFLLAMPTSRWAVHFCSIVIMSNKDPLDLILRRLQVERRKRPPQKEVGDFNRL
jgi:hypothetical protein